MKEKTFYNRIQNYGLLRIFKSKDFILSILGYSILHLLSIAPTMGNKSLINAITSYSGSVIAVILTGLAIIISISDSEFISFLKKIDVFDSLIFIFEWNAYLAISVTIIGISLNSYNPNWIFQIFLFLTIYLTASLLNLISFVSYYGQTKAQYDRNSK